MKEIHRWNLLFLIFAIVFESSFGLIPTAQNSTIDIEDESCTFCNNVEMSVELADKINAIEDVDIFVHDFVEDTNSLSNMTNIKSTRARRAAKETMRQATCKPNDQVVSLVPKDERDPTIFYFPSCVLLKQCGGCCAHSGTTCSPTDEEEKVVTVKRTKFAGGTKFENLGDITVTVKEHKKCRCQCKKTAADCNSLQRFIPGQCICECTNLKEAGACTKDAKKLWDSKTCGCVCRDTKECGSDSFYDQSDCSCKPRPKDESNEDDDAYPYFGDHSLNETSEAVDPSDDTKYETITETI